MSGAVARAAHARAERAAERLAARMEAAAPQARIEREGTQVVARGRGVDALRWAGRLMR